MNKDSFDFVEKCIRNVLQEREEKPDAITIDIQPENDKFAIVDVRHDEFLCDCTLEAITEELYAFDAVDFVMNKPTIVGTSFTVELK